MEEIVAILAEEATSNLPGQVEALLTVQQEHASATADLQATSAQLENKIEKVRECNKQLLNQKNKLITNMCTTESERDERKLRIENLERELSQEIYDNECLKLQLDRIGQELKTFEKTQSESSHRIGNYKGLVEKLEQSSPEIKTLEEAQEKLNKLQGERDSLQREICMLAGDGHTDDVTRAIRREATELEAQVDELKLISEKAKCQLNHRRLDRKRQETTNMILKKKNAALLIRMGRLVDSQKQKFDLLTQHIETTTKRLAATEARLRGLDN